MSNTNGAREKNGKGPTRREDIDRLVQTRDWNGLEQYLGFSILTPEEAERILQEEPRIDAAEVNRMLGITDEEIAAVLKSPPSEVITAPKHGQ